MAREYQYDAIQLATGRWQVVNVTTNRNVGLPTDKETALRRVGEFNRPWRGAAR